MIIDLGWDISMIGEGVKEMARLQIEKKMSDDEITTAVSLIIMFLHFQNTTFIIKMHMKMLSAKCWLFCTDFNQQRI